MPLLEAYALGQMATFMLVIHWISFVYATYIGSEMYYDATGIGCIAFMAVLSAFKSGTFFPRQVLVTAMVLLWAARLGSFLVKRIHAVGKDSRFDKMRGVLVTMFLVFSLSAVWGFLCLLPVFVINGFRHDTPLGPNDWIGVGVFLFGFVFEWIADAQKLSFNQGGAAKNKWIQHGLWRWSRHPNYFGEIVIWFGVWVIALPEVSGWGHLILVGPLSVVFFLCFVSGVPLLERKADRRWGDVAAYQQYKRRTSVLVPLPPSLYAACAGRLSGNNGGTSAERAGAGL